MANALGPVYVHRADGRRPWAPPPAPPPPSTDRADADTRHRGYCVALAAMTLDDGDRAALLARGLAAEDIARAQYRTLHVAGRARIARAVVDALGADDAARVPGVVWRVDPVDSSRGWWSLAGAPGIVVPSRDDAGRIAALVVRRRDPCDGARYTMVSSAAAGGPAADAALHVPLGARERFERGASLVVAEGILKADVAAALSAHAVVGVPGVARWPLALDLATRWGARSVAIAYDADAATNPNVAYHLRAFVGALAAAGVRPAVWTWPSTAGKGLDDVLLAARRAAASTSSTSSTPTPTEPHP
jgi:hypothetical protein